MAPTRLCLLALLLLSSTRVSGEILFWTRGSNWDNPVNWNQSRLPCSAETVLITPPKGRLLPATFDVQISTDVSLKKLLIPIGGSLTLKRGGKLSLSTAGTCKDQGLTSVTDQSINSFIGVQLHPWDCVGNWRNSKGVLPSQPPCGEDTVVFQANNSYSWIELNSQVKVARLGWLGQSVDGLSDIPDYDKYFYKSTPSADLTVDPSCLTGNPERCPCQASNCSFYPTTPSPTTIAPTTTAASTTQPPPTTKKPTTKPPTTQPLPTTKAPTDSIITSNQGTPSVSSTAKMSTSSPDQPSAGHTSTKPTTKTQPPRSPTTQTNVSEKTRPPTGVTDRTVTERAATDETSETEEPIPCNGEDKDNLCPSVKCPDGSQTCGDSDQNTGDSNSILWIAVGAGVGGALLLIILIVVIVVVLRKRKSKASYHKDGTTPVIGEDSLSGYPAYTAYDVPPTQSTLSSSGFKNPVFQEMVQQNPIYNNPDFLPAENPEMVGQGFDNPYESLDDYVKSE